MIRKEGVQELIEVIDEAIEKAGRIQVSHFDSSPEPGRNEGWHAVEDLRCMRRFLAAELADLQEEEGE